MAARREARRILEEEQYFQPAIRTFRDRLNPLECFSDSELIAKYRFNAAVISQITELIQDQLNQQRGNSALPPLLQVCVALRFFACGAFQETIGDTIRISKSTVSRSIYKVSSALSDLLQQHVQFPRNEEIPIVMARFYEKARFPRVIGAIDGTHVRIQAPAVNEEVYVNRKGYHSLNIQVVVDADLLFRNCVIRWPGSVHDSRIFAESQLLQDFSQHHPDGYLLGDSGYQTYPFLLTPFPAPVRREEHRYNNAHACTRNSVERGIGVLKRRFACLNMLRLCPERCVKAIASCVVLHNMARRHNIPLIDTEEEFDMGDMDIAVPDGNANGAIIRAAVARHFA